jgi:propanol-preferring alcohol dehydrogenase
MGLYGFGAAAHDRAVATHEGKTVHAFTPGDAAGQAFARELARRGPARPTPRRPSRWMRDHLRPAGPGTLALQAVRKGGRVVCGGIHMSDIPSFAYRLLWEERQLVSVANLTRADAAEFLAIAARLPLRVETTTYPLREANQALADLRAGRLNGAAVLVP